jgi:ketosteroid isomerase-like protein
MRSLALALLGLTSFAVAALANGPAAGAPAAGDAALLDADRALASATAERGLAGFLAGFAPDATVSRFGAPDLAGEAAIRAYLAPAFAAPGFAFTWEPEAAHAAASGDLGWTWGRYRVSADGAAGAARLEEAGLYVRVWRRPRAAGPWQVVAEVINTRSALPTGARPAAPAAEQLPTTAIIQGAPAALMLADRDFDQETAERGAAGWIAWFEPDGLQVGGNDKLLRGHAAIRAEMEPLLGDPATDLRWRPLVADAAAAGDLGYTIGAWDFVERRAGAAPAVTARGRYLTVWRKQPDGGWKVVADIGNPSL